MIMTTHNVSGTVELMGVTVEYYATIGDIDSGCSVYGKEFVECEQPDKCTDGEWDLLWEDAEAMALADAYKQLHNRKG